MEDAIRDMTNEIITLCKNYDLVNEKEKVDILIKIQDISSKALSLINTIKKNPQQKKQIQKIIARANIFHKNQIPNQQQLHDERYKQQTTPSFPINFPLSNIILKILNYNKINTMLKKAGINLLPQAYISVSLFILFILIAIIALLNIFILEQPPTKISFGIIMLSILLLMLYPKYKAYKRKKEVDNTILIASIKIVSSQTDDIPALLNLLSIEFPALRPELLYALNSFYLFKIPLHKSLEAAKEFSPSEKYSEFLSTLSDAIKNNIPLEKALYKKAEENIRNAKVVTGLNGISYKTKPKLIFKGYYKKQHIISFIISILLITFAFINYFDFYYPTETPLTFYLLIFAAASIFWVHYFITAAFTIKKEITTKEDFLRFLQNAENTYKSIIQKQIQKQALSKAKKTSKIDISNIEKISLITKAIFEASKLDYSTINKAIKKLNRNLKLNLPLNIALKPFADEISNHELKIIINSGLKTLKSNPDNMIPLMERYTLISLI